MMATYIYIACPFCILLPRLRLQFWKFFAMISQICPNVSFVLTRQRQRLPPEDGMSWHAIVSNSSWYAMVPRVTSCSCQHLPTSQNRPAGTKAAAMTTGHSEIAWLADMVSSKCTTFINFQYQNSWKSSAPDASRWLNICNRWFQRISSCLPWKLDKIGTFGTFGTFGTY